MITRYETATIFLNRACPRGCPQCGISDNSKTPMSIDQWIGAIKVLKKTLGTKFFLFLGTEPLLFRDDLIWLVEWLTENEIFYGFYSTSPQPLFSDYKYKLVRAGLKNWSSGIDALPWHDGDDVTRSKVTESLNGLLWMANEGVQTHTLTTIHKKNLHQVVEIMEWCQRHIPGVQSSLNFLEWKRGPEFDFFSPKSEMMEYLWHGSPEEKEEIRKVMAQVKLLSRVHGNIIQTPDSYLDNAHKHYLKLNQHCQGVIGPSIDCDGTMRLCGYSTGKHSKPWHVFDLTHHKDSFLHDWEADLDACNGCHWIFQDMLKEDPRILDPKSGFHEERWNETWGSYLIKKGRV